MPTFTFFDEFKKYLGDGTIDLDTHTFRLFLTSTAPTAATNTVRTDLTAGEVANGNGYTTGGEALTSVAWAETGSGTGIWRFTSADVSWTASGGDFSATRYFILYDDTPSSPADPLVGYLDYGASFTLTNGNTLTFDVGASGIFTLQ